MPARFAVCVVVVVIVVVVAAAAAVDGKVLEDKVADDAAERATDGCLAVEQGEAAAELEAGVEEGEVGDGDGVEAGCLVSVTAARCTVTAARHTLETANDDSQRVELPSRLDPDVQHGAQPPQQHARRHPRNHAIPAAQRGAGGLEGDEEGEEEGDGGVEVAFVEPNVSREVRRLCVANLAL